MRDTAMWGIVMQRFAVIRSREGSETRRNHSYGKNCV